MRLVLLRIVLLLGAALAAGAALSARFGAPALAATPLLGALWFLPVNAVCLALLRRAVRREGGRLRDLAGFDRRRLGRDLAQGLAWQAALFVPFALAIHLVMLLAFGPGDVAGAYERVFAPDPAATAGLPAAFTTVAALVVALLFPLTNAPTEELLYRGWAQRRLLAAGRPAALALGLPSLAFGLQHVPLAPTVPGMVVYAVAFTVWGLGAALIVRRQGRLMPMIVAHLITNALTASVPLALVVALG